MNSQFYNNIQPVQKCTGFSFVENNEIIANELTELLNAIAHSELRESENDYEKLLKIIYDVYGSTDVIIRRNYL